MTLERAIKKLQDIINLQCSEGNYNYNAYKWGLANGLLLAMAIISGKRQDFLNKPERWLEDLPDINPNERIIGNDE